MVSSRTSLRVDSTGIRAATSDWAPAAQFSWFWLRDHGEDFASQDPATLQRRVDTLSLAPDCQPTGAAQAALGRQLASDPEVFDIDWPDGVTTTHSRRQIEAVADEYLTTDWSCLVDRQPQIPAGSILWSTPSISPEPLDLEPFLVDQDTLTFGVAQLTRFGYLVLRGGDPSPHGAEQFAQRLGYVRQTIFGGIWGLAPDLDDHADTAYSTQFLGPHTDSTYSHDPPGLQFFLCLTPATEGGESLLVDGFAIAEEMKQSDPDIYCDLASIPVPGRYIEPGVHLRAERPVLKADARGRLEQVSFNNYDRAPFLLPSDLEPRFYRAYRQFGQMAYEPDRRAIVTLDRGDVLVFDNWRVLHGRNSFSGPRHYVGAYLNHEDLESKQRVLAS